MAAERIPTGGYMAGERIDTGNGITAYALRTMPSNADGSDTNVAQGSSTSGQRGPLVQGAVVTGDQTYAVGETRPVNLTPDGRLKVALSAATNVAPAAPPASNNNALLMAARYLATRPTWTDGNTGSLQVDQRGNLYTVPTNLAPTAGTNLSGTATTTSGGFNLPASATRRPGDVQGQNVSGVNVGFNEFGGVAAIGSAGTYVVPPNGSFSISTNQQVNFIAASGTAAVTITGL